MNGKKIRMRKGKERVPISTEKHATKTWLEKRRPSETIRGKGGNEAGHMKKQTCTYKHQARKKRNQTVDVTLKWLSTRRTIDSHGSRTIKKGETGLCVDSETNQKKEES